MELFFRKYFWVVNLVFLFGAAFLSAKTANVLIGGAIMPKPTFAAPAAPAALPVTTKKVQLSLEAISKVTGIALPPPEPEKTEQAPDLSADPVKSSLRVKLLGTMVANNPEWSMANIDDSTSRNPAVYMVGDVVQNATILEIQRLRIIILNNNRKEYIDTDGDAPILAPPPLAHASVPAPPGLPGSNVNVKSTGEGNFEIPKDELNKALGNLGEIATQASSRVAYKDGVPIGFKLFSIKQDSLYAKIGIQNGDVVRRINGYEINDPAKGLEILTKLREASRIEVELERNGTPTRMTYNVR